jgi:hypothetical protein
MLDICVFNVGLGQCIFLYPSENNAEYSALIDCGSSEDFNPVNFIRKYLPINNSYPTLKSLILTNYDEDHFSGVIDLKRKVTIETICFPKNLTSQEIRETKTQETDSLNTMLELKDKYTWDVPEWLPPYAKYTYSLNKSNLENWNTNNLSMLIFIEYSGFVMCVPGDLEQKGWEQILKKTEVSNMLQKTRLFIASHHGRNNGYCPDVFDLCKCKPECVIISDEFLQYDTQNSMSAKYSKHVENGISFNSVTRKVLTTRNDGHILVKVDNSGKATYNKLEVN